MRKVLITAGASGIGKEIATAFLAAGDSVYTCDINQAALDAAARELPGLKTGICDVGDRQQIETMVADAVAQLGRLDILSTTQAYPARPRPFMKWMSSSEKRSSK